MSEALGEDLVANINNTFSHPDCPEMFTMVAEQCLSVFSVGKVGKSVSHSAVHYLVSLYLAKLYRIAQFISFFENGE